MHADWRDLLQDLRSIGRACPRLQTLNISRCHHLKPDALQPLLPPQYPRSIPSSMDGPLAGLLCREPVDGDVEQEADAGILHTESLGTELMLPDLRNVDVSYCHLPTAAISQLLGQASHLQVIPCPCKAREVDIRTANLKGADVSLVMT